MEPKKKYLLTSISLDVNNIYWVNYIGEYPEQGGLNWGHSQIGLHSLEDALRFIEATFDKNLDKYKEQIQKRTSDGT